jgi:colicin import membrane protein
MGKEIKNELALTTESVGAGLDINESQKLHGMFVAYFERMSEIETKINGLNKDNPKREDIQIARTIRLSLRDNRIASEKVKDELKAAGIIRGRLIDALNNVIKNQSKTLELQCEQIEKDAEIKEAARVEYIRSSRAELLAPYTEDTSIFPLGTMSEEQFETMLSGYKLTAQQKKEAAEKAEAERLQKEAAEKLEQERIRLENERLKAEAKEKEDALAAERAETARLAKIESDKQAKEKAANEARLKAAADEADRLQKRLAEKEAREKAEKDRVTKELAAKKAEEKRLAKAPIKDKMKLAINALSLQLPESDVTTDILSKYEGFKAWALQQIETL